MTRTKIFSMSMALALLLAFGLAGLDAAEARSPRHGGPLAAYTPEQQTEFRALWEDHYQQTEPLLRQLRSKRAELDVLYYGGALDAAKVQKVFRDMADIKARLYMLDADFHARSDAKGFHSDCGPRGGLWRGIGMMGGAGRGAGMMGGSTDCDLPRSRGGSARLPNPYGPRGPMGYCQ